MKPWMQQAVFGAFAIAIAGAVIVWPIWTTRTLLKVQEDVSLIRCVIERQSTLSPEPCFGRSDDYASH